MGIKRALAAPCGFYCGACAVYIAHKDNIPKLKERQATFHGVSMDDIRCEGCLSDEPFIFCRTCPVKSCTNEKGIEGCHQCDDFPCKIIGDFTFPVGEKVILRSVPARRELGTEKWMEEEEKRYHCPYCGYKLFRGVIRCPNCKNPVDVD